jgi:hypothetical protein
MTTLTPARDEQLTLLDPRVWNLFFKPGEVVEVRVIGVSGKSNAWSGDFISGSSGIANGYFDDHGAFCSAVRAVDKEKHGGCYFTLQVIDPRLIGRAFNRLVSARLATSDRDVLAYRWLPIDLDPVRPAGVSSSEPELISAVRMRDRIAPEIAKRYDLPSYFKAISGNGAHLLYRLPDWPAKDSLEAVKMMVEEISEEHSTDSVNVDAKVFNPARIWKLYGTTSRKGDAVPAGKGREERPHRESYIDAAVELEVAHG